MTRKITMAFTLEVQYEFLRLTLLDDKGYRVLDYIKNEHFTLIQHSVIYYAIEVAFKRLGRIPGKAIITEILEEIFYERNFATSLSNEDRQEIRDIFNSIYTTPLKDADVLLEMVAKFAAFLAVKKVSEEFDLTDYSSYNSYASNVQRAINIANVDKEDTGVYLIRDIKDRQMKRQAQEAVVPTPFPAINRLTNAGGYEKGSIIVILDRPKKLKTTALVNISRGYMRQKKRVLFIDLENGQEGIAVRLEQSTGKVTKKEILAGVKDKAIQKILRRYKRMGGEVLIRRLPAYSTTTAIQLVIDEDYRDTGKKFNVLVIDYLALMGSLSGGRHSGDDTQRIGDAYIDVANLALKNNFDHVWTAMHVQRAAHVRSITRYRETDIAKAIDIIRHVHAIFGLNRTQDEIDAGIVRWEIVAQRDGVPVGRAYFRSTPDTQRMDELTKKEVEELEALTGGPPVDEDDFGEDSNRRGGDI